MEYLEHYLNNCHVEYDSEQEEGQLMIVVDDKHYLYYTIVDIDVLSFDDKSITFCNEDDDAVIAVQEVDGTIVIKDYINNNRSEIAITQ